MKLKSLFILATVILLSRNLVMAQSDVPELINYQGYVTDAAGIALGNSAPLNTEVDFKFFNAPTGGTAIYGERQTVTINKGDFSVLIGGGDQIPDTAKPALSSIFSLKDIFLELTIDKDENGIEDDAPITPRQQIVTTAFAFRSKIAEAVDDLAITESMLASSSITTAKLSDGAVTANKLGAGSVFSNTIANGTILTDDLANNSISLEKLQPDSVNGSKIQDGTITGADIADASITTADIADDTLTDADFKVGSVDRYALGNGSVQTAFGDEIVMLRGTFNSNGSVAVASTGLTCVRNGTGVYTLNYPGIFDFTPTVVASSYGNSTTYYDNIVSVGVQYGTYCQIRVIDGGSNGGSPQDGPFSVVIVGPGK